jgi:hypothetical protein
LRASGTETRVFDECELLVSFAHAPVSTNLQHFLSSPVFTSTAHSLAFSFHNLPRRYRTLLHPTMNICTFESVYCTKSPYYYTTTADLGIGHALISIISSQSYHRHTFGQGLRQAPKGFRKNRFHHIFTTIYPEENSTLTGNALPRLALQFFPAPYVSSSYCGFLLS